MLKKLSLALFLGAFVLSAASLTAQVVGVTLTEKEIDLYLTFTNSRGPRPDLGMYQRANPTYFSGVMGKINNYLFLKLSNQSDDALHKALATSLFKYSQEEIELLKSRDAELSAAFKKLSGHP
ncbi:MAG: hypothetical protein LBT38_10185 [Deltaproteobacteria bacterium]|nr:hypothetical protein [Deltaproteobacteria bacterium]